MQQYDATLKNLMQRLSPALMETVMGYRIAEWRNVELPAVNAPRVDLLGETAEARLVHIELQSNSDSDMGLRMAEYALAIRRRYGRMPVQLVLYVGLEPSNMKTRMEGPHMVFECPLIDIRDLDGEIWLNSGRVDDNIFAVLRRFQRSGRSDTYHPGTDRCSR